ncbi:MAG: hypothetical protein RLZZ618_2899 [Pseudomonadota bacterium]|jgi:hypothetical protein
MKIRHLLPALAFALAGTAASAQVSFTKLADVSFPQEFNPNGGAFAPGAFTSGEIGYFTALSEGTFSLTYLGQESGYFNSVRTTPGFSVSENDDFGDSTTGLLHTGQSLGFEFRGSDGSRAANGTEFAGHASFAVLARNVTNQYGHFDYLLGFNDGALHDDFDDFTVGLNVASAVPEPQGMLMMLAGLGLVGFIARRSKR